MLVQSLGQEDSLEEGMETHSSILGPSQVALVLKNPSASARDESLILVLGTHSSILACRIRWTEEYGYSPWGCKESDMTETT